MMSKVKELADKEAQRAEAQPDEPDEPNGDTDDKPNGDEAQPLPATPGEPTQEDMARLRAEHDRHEAAMREILGEDFDELVECEAGCMMGYAPPAQLQAHADYKMCDTCNGFGVVLTGSRVETGATTQCPSCQGRGYLQRLTPPTPTGEHGPPPANGAEQFGTPTWMGSPDVKPEPIFGPPS